MQAKFIACYEATGQAVWLKNFIPRLKVVDSISRPLVLYCDNDPQFSIQVTTSQVLPGTLTLRSER
jgi:hypothetical protein